MFQIILIVYMFGSFCSSMYFTSLTAESLHKQCKEYKPNILDMTCGLMWPLVLVGIVLALHINHIKNKFKRNTI